MQITLKLVQTPAYHAANPRHVVNHVGCNQDGIKLQRTFSPDSTPANLYTIGGKERVAELPRALCLG